MPTDAPVGPTQQTSDLLVAFNRLAYATVSGDEQWHLRHTGLRETLFTLCLRPVVKGSALAWNARSEVCRDCQQVASKHFPHSHILLRGVTYPALPITEERAKTAVAPLWSVKTTCGTCSVTLLSVEGTDPEALADTLIAAKQVVASHRAEHKNQCESGAEVVWADDHTAGLVDHLLEIIAPDPSTPEDDDRA